MKTSTMLIAGAAGVAALVLVPKIKEFTGFRATAFPGKGNAYAYAYGRNMLPPHVMARRGPRF